MGTRCATWITFSRRRLQGRTESVCATRRPSSRQSTVGIGLGHRFLWGRVRDVVVVVIWCYMIVNGLVIGTSGRQESVKAVRFFFKLRVESTTVLSKKCADTFYCGKFAWVTYLFAAMETGKDLCCGPRSIGGFSRNGLFWCKLVSIERRRISLSTEMFS